MAVTHGNSASDKDLPPCPAVVPAPERLNHKTFRYGLGGFRRLTALIMTERAPLHGDARFPPCDAQFVPITGSTCQTGHAPEVLTSPRQLHHGAGRFQLAGSVPATIMPRAPNRDSHQVLMQF